MFELFSKLKQLTSRRPTNQQKEQQAAQKAPQKASTQEIAATQRAEKKDAQEEATRQAFMARVDQLANDEPALIAALLSCDFADGRFRAAQHVSSAAGLVQVRNAMRNNDKRVAKLMQSRIDLIKHAEQQAQQSQACLEQAKKLLSLPHIMTNQVADLDKQRTALSEFSSAYQAEYTEVRAAIEQQMQAQVDLQRRVLDCLQMLRDMRVPSIDDEVTSTDDFTARLDTYQEELAGYLSHPASASLPKNLLQEGALILQSKRDQFAAFEAAAQVKQGSGRASRGAQTDSLVEQSQDTMSAVQESNSQEESEPISAVMTAQSAATAKKMTPKLSHAQIEEILNAMEEALEQGSVQGAKKFDRQSREIDAQENPLSQVHKERLQKIRAELGNLLAWAKWGGDVSREELIKALEDLPSQALPPMQLAKKVTALRERWKEMERVSGAANKDSWTRFDAACQIAYAPAAQFFQEQALERQANLKAAQDFLVEMQTKLALILAAPADWKAYTQFCQTQQQEWKKIGHVDRKHRVPLDAEFESLFQQIWQPLQERRREEIESRAALIKSVQAIDPNQRNAVDQLKALQERWQKQASSVPLKRQDEQRLWEEFRSACDAVFAQRKEVNLQADAQRQQQLLEREAFCAELETVVVQLEVAGMVPANERLKQAPLQWKSFGAVPKAAEAQIEQRFQTAVQSLSNRLQELQKQKKAAGKELFLRKLHLCVELEQTLASMGADLVESDRIRAISDAWNQLNASLTKSHAPLVERFQNDIAALRRAEPGFAERLKANQVEFDSTLLRLEIMCGVESPPELARERLQMQVEVLQQTMKLGSPDQIKSQLFQSTVRQPVLLDAPRVARLEKLLTYSDYLN